MYQLLCTEFIVQWANINEIYNRYIDARVVERLPQRQAKINGFFERHSNMNERTFPSFMAYLEFWGEC